MKIKIQRSQCYATIKDALSFNYRWSSPMPPLESEDNIWSSLRINDHDAREGFFEYVKSGKQPDYSKNIFWVKKWLDENGHKPGWESAADTQRHILGFLDGGYKKAAAQLEYCEVEITVETVEPYAFGTFDVPSEKAVMFSKEKTYSYTRDGYIEK